MLPVPSGVSAGTRATAAALGAGARRATAAPATEAHSLVWAEFSVGRLADHERRVAWRRQRGAVGAGAVGGSDQRHRGPGADDRGGHRAHTTPGM